MSRSTEAMKNENPKRPVRNSGRSNGKAKIKRTTVALNQSNAADLEVIDGDASSNGRSTRKSAVKPATRSQLRQAERVRKQEQARKENREKNKERVREGKKTKADPGTVEKKSIWEKVAEDRLYYQLREMGDSTKNINKFQRKRMLFSLFIVLLGVLAGMFIHVWLYLSGPILGFAFYKMQAKQVDNYYRGWKFQRQLNFSKFTRLVIPYMKASGGKTALYTIFNKILQRTDDEADKRNLYQLMSEMGDKPQQLEPFSNYAERSSGTDMSHLFMQTIFDFQQSTFDVSVIDELGKMASEDMMNAIDEIIAMKLRRFVMFPTKVVMSSFILVAGLGVGLMIDNFKDLDFGGGIMDPAGQAQETQAETDAATSGDASGADTTDATDAESDTETADEAAARESFEQNNYQPLDDDGAESSDTSSE